MATIYFSRQQTATNLSNGDRITTNSLWATDGTAAGTRLVRDAVFRDETTTTHITDITPFRGGIAFDTPRGARADQTGLWFSDGSGAGTYRIEMTGVGALGSPAGMTNFGGQLLFGGANVNAFGLWTSNGAAEGTRQLASIFSLGLNELTDFTTYGGRAYFIAEFQGNNGFGRPDGTSQQAVYRTDGTSAGTTRVLNAGSNDVEMVSFGGVLYVLSRSEVTGSASYFQIVGNNAPQSLAGGQVPAPLLSTDLDNIVELDRGVLYVGAVGSSGNELLTWSAGGAGTLVRDINPGSASSLVQGFTIVDGVAYFSATTAANGSELWRSDGTAGGTFMVADLAAGSAGSSPNNLREFDGILYFTTIDGGLWRTNGTAAGTERIASDVDVLGGFGFDALSLTGQGSADILLGGDTNDFFRGFGGDDFFDGRGGLDTAVFRGARASYVVDRSSASVTTIRDTSVGRDGLDTVAGIERLRFTDGTLAFDTAQNAGQMYRLYQAAFARDPDAAGLGFWIKRLDAGQTDLFGAARGFIASNEFRTAYGAPETVSNGAFVDLLYRNILGRAGEAGGTAFWNQRLADGASREQVLVSFSESAENINGVASEIQNGIWFL